MTHLSDGGDFVLSLFAGERASDAHIGFIQDTEEQVNAVYRRLRDDGFEADPPRRSHGWTFSAPGGLIVEVVC